MYTNPEDYVALLVGLAIVGVVVWLAFKRSERSQLPLKGNRTGGLLWRRREHLRFNVDGTPMPSIGGLDTKGKPFGRRHWLGR
jgi:hypothetical protein